MNPFAALGRFAVRFRWLVVVVWVVGAPLATKSLPSLSSVAKNDNTAFLPASAPSMRAADLGVPFQSKTKGTALLLAVRSGGPLTAADRGSIDRALSAVAAVPAVQLVRDQGTSADGEAEKIALQLDVPPFAGGDQATNAVDAVRHALARVSAPPGLAFHLAGDIPTFVDEQNATRHSQGLTQRLAVLFIVALLLVVFRALLAPFVTLIPAVLALAVAEPVIAEATHIGVQVSSLLQLLLVVIVLGAGTDYGLFLIFRMREELRAGREPKDAVVVSVTRVGESITFSAATVIAALVSLLLASFGLYKGLGPGLAIGVGMVLIANLTLLPALLALLGRAVFWPLVPARRSAAPGGVGNGGRPGGGAPGADPRGGGGALRRPGALDARLLAGGIRRRHRLGHERLGAGPGRPERALRVVGGQSHQRAAAVPGPGVVGPRRARGGPARPGGDGPVLRRRRGARPRRPRGRLHPRPARGAVQRARGRRSACRARPPPGPRWRRAPTAPTAPRPSS